MASSGRGKAPTSSQPAPPTEFANVPPPAMLDHSFTLQAVMELQKSVAELATKTDRLIKDVEGQVTKIDGIGHQISFVKGALWVFGGLFAIATVVVGLVALYVRMTSH